MKIQVGKTSRKRVRHYYFSIGICVLLLLLPYGLFLFLLEPIIYFITVLLLTVLILVFAFFVIPGLTYMDSLWEVNDHDFRMIIFKNAFEKSFLYYSRLFKKEYVPFQIVLILEHIDFITVTYYHDHMYPSKYLLGESRYKTVIKFCMKDGSQYFFENMISNDRQAFFKGIAALQKKGIRLIDQHKILTAYKNGNHIQSYLASLEKEKNHD